MVANKLDLGAEDVEHIRELLGRFPPPINTSAPVLKTNNWWDELTG